MAPSSSNKIAGNQGTPAKLTRRELLQEGRDHTEQRQELNQKLSKLRMALESLGERF